MEELDKLERLHKEACFYFSDNSEDECVLFIQTCQRLVPSLIKVVREAKIFLNYVNKDHAEWKEPLENALEALEKARG